jgi:hypothetical protein
MGFT